MIYDNGLLVIDLYRLLNATWKAILLATPIWICYLMIKIKVRGWINEKKY